MIRTIQRCPFYRGLTAAGLGLALIGSAAVAVAETPLEPGQDAQAQPAPADQEGPAPGMPPAPMPGAPGDGEPEQAPGMPPAPEGPDGEHAPPQPGVPGVPGEPEEGDGEQPIPDFVPIPGAEQQREDPVAQIEARAFEAPEDEQIIEGFIESISEDEQFEADLREEVVERIRADLDGPFDPADVLGDAVADLVPAFGDGLDALFEEDLDAAIEHFRQVIGHENPYVDAHARFYAAQVLVNQERLEEALELLELLTEEHADKTLYASDAAFYRGVAEGGTLRRAEALSTMRGFIESFPDASARMIDGARQMAYDLELLVRYEGYLEDVHDRMQFSRRKLALEETGDPTQEQHREIIEIIERLIEEAEQEEEQGQGGGDGGGEGGQEGQQGAGDPSGGPGGAQQSAAVPGQSQMGEQRDVEGRAEAWGGLPPHERERIEQTLQERYPDHYRALIEQYYQGLRRGEIESREQSGEAFDED